jgi:hypothetical protein
VPTVTMLQQSTTGPLWRVLSPQSLLYRGPADSERGSLCRSRALGPVTFSSGCSVLAIPHFTPQLRKIRELAQPTAQPGCGLDVFLERGETDRETERQKERKRERVALFQSWPGTDAHTHPQPLSES